MVIQYVATCALERLFEVCHPVLLWQGLCRGENVASASKFETAVNVTMTEPAHPHDKCLISPPQVG